jgi:signal transduction histidine kinase
MPSFVDALIIVGFGIIVLALVALSLVSWRNSRLIADLRQRNSQMITSLEGAKEQVERLDSVKTDFITVASHELRTPLAQIRGYTDILDALNDSGMLDEDQIAGMVVNLRKAGERMEELIAAMLDVSQLDVNAMDLHFAPTSLENVLRVAIEPLSDAIKTRRLALSARGLRNLPIIQADQTRLVQAFRNVIVNAVKFTPDGGRIEINGMIQPDQVVISIADSGVGIDRENLPLIFKKFYRCYDPTYHSTGGAYNFMGAGPGLGLTIAQGVIAGHGGRIWAESLGHSMEYCPGVTVYLLLPLVPPQDARRVLPFHQPRKLPLPVYLRKSDLRPVGERRKLPPPRFLQNGNGHVRVNGSQTPEHEPELYG